MLRDKIFFFFFMLLDHHLSKQRPKGHADSRIYACFVHQTKDSQTLEENVKEAAAERLFSATPAFIWHLTREVGEKKDVQRDV